MPPNWNHYTRIREKRTIQQKQEQVKMTIDEKLGDWIPKEKKKDENRKRKCCAELWRPCKHS